MHNPVDVKVDNSIAAMWSLMLPGLGHLLKGQVMAGIFWAFFTGFGYFAYLWPGVIIHAACILDAAFNRGENSLIGFDTWPKRLLFSTLVLGLLAYVYFRL